MGPRLRLILANADRGTKSPLVVRMCNCSKSCSDCEVGLLMVKMTDHAPESV